MHAPNAVDVAETRVSNVRIAAWLLGIVGISTVLRFAFARQAAAPWIIPDELVYSELARSFASTGEFAVRGDAFSAWSFGPLYPMVIAPAYRAFSSLPQSYLLVKGINCLLFSSAAVPAYFLARRFLDRRMALVLAALGVAVPSGIYTSKVMTESLAYPLFLVAILAIVRALEAPTWRRELAAIAAIGVATLARGQLIVLFPALVATLLVVAVFDQREAGRGRDLRQLGSLLAAYRVTWLVTVTGAAAVAAMAMLGLSDELAGGHGEAFAGVPALTLAASFLFHIAEFDLYLGMIPFAATIVVCAYAFRRGQGDRSLRILCALAVSLTILLAAAAARYLIAVYQGTPHAYAHVFDRYVFYTAPLFFIAFLVWVRDGLPRPRWAVRLTAVAILLPFVLPYSHLLNGREWGVSSSTVGLLPLAMLRIVVGTPLVVYPLLAGGGIYLGYQFLRAQNGRRVMHLVAENLLLLNLVAGVASARVADLAVEYSVGEGNTGERGWIDRAVGRDARVAALWSGVEGRGIKGWYTIWENEFFNASIGRIYNLREPVRYELPDRSLVVRGRELFLANGSRFRARYVLTDVSTPIVGIPIARNRPSGLVLYRVGTRSPSGPAANVVLRNPARRGGDAD